MFHRHRHADDGRSSSGQQWGKAVGNVVGKRLLPARYPPHPKIFVVQPHPEGREPFQAEVYVSPDDPNWENPYQPELGDVRGTSSRGASSASSPCAHSRAPVSDAQLLAPAATA